MKQMCTKPINLYGDGCPGCQTLALADEFFNEVEDEEEFTVTS